jgi:prepilin-type N-terminal cleavage/methylation domain-containing protein
MSGQVGLEYVQMMSRAAWNLRSPLASPRHRQAIRFGTQGFSLIEMILVVSIALLMAVMAIPLLNNIMNAYRLRSAVSSVTGFIQSARYQALSSGYGYQVVFDKAASTIQIQSDPNRVNTYTNLCVPAAPSCPIPLSGSGIPVVLGADTTLQFRPSGIVTATAGSTTLTVTYGGKTETITVSSYGNVKVTP